jgi:AcrR family transcriptional regulator
MTTEYAGVGDARRSMDLLWGNRDSPTRGPKPGLSVATIVAAAIEVADAEGLSALSMRKVGDRLGKSAMALYTYVPGKSELLDLMIDTVQGELRTDYSEFDRWRDAIEASCRDGWEFYQRHPWVLQIAGARATLGPHEFDAYETQLRLLDGIGLSGVEMTRAVGLVAGFVRGSAKAVADARAAEQVTGVSDDEWWNARSPILEEFSAELGEAWVERYPTITRLGTEQAFDQLDRPDDTTPYLVQDALDTFEFGLQRVLDGLEVYIGKRRTDAPADES